MYNWVQHKMFKKIIINLLPKHTGTLYENKAKLILIQGCIYKNVQVVVTSILLFVINSI